MSDAVVDLLEKIARVQAAHAVARKIYNSELSIDFDVFDFVQKDELGLSRIIAWLIDQNASHAQGDVFLRLFMEEFVVIDYYGKPFRFRGNTKTVTEKTIDALRRIDIFIDGGTNCVAIENKPFATDQDAQVHDYISWMKKRSKNGDCRLVYLSPNGDPPSDNSLRGLSEVDIRTYVISVGYPSLLSWLSQCRCECRSSRVMGFIAEFERYIRRTFCGVSEMNETIDIATALSKSPEFLSAAFAIQNSIPTLQAQLIQKLKTDLQGELPGFVIEGPSEPLSAYKGIIIRDKNADRDVYFCIEPQSRSFKEVIFGLKKKNKSPFGPIRDWKALLGDGKESEWWGWYRYCQREDIYLSLPRDWQIDASVWIEARDGVLAKKIVSAFRAIEEKLDQKPVVSTDSLIG